MKLKTWAHLRGHEQTHFARRAVCARVDGRLVRQVLHERRDRWRERLRRERSVREHITVGAEARAARCRRRAPQRGAAASAARSAALSLLLLSVARSRGRRVARVRAAAVSLGGSRAVAEAAVGEAIEALFVLAVLVGGGCCGERLMIELRLVSVGAIGGRVELRVVPGICARRSSNYRGVASALATGSE